jgi:hypothetical protein
MTIKLSTIKPGDIVHVRGKIIDVDSHSKTVAAVFDENCEHAFYFNEIVAHFPAIRSWSEIEGRLLDLLPCLDTHERNAVTSEIIALLNEVEPKGQSNDD